MSHIAVQTWNFHCRCGCECGKTPLWGFYAKVVPAQDLPEGNLRISSTHTCRDPRFKEVFGTVESPKYVDIDGNGAVANLLIYASKTRPELVGELDLCVTAEPDTRTEYVVTLEEGHDNKCDRCR